MTPRTVRVYPEKCGYKKTPHVIFSAILKFEIREHIKKKIRHMNEISTVSVFMETTGRSRNDETTLSQRWIHLTIWRRNYFLILAHRVYKM